ncbi:MAG: TOBE domain-containing protein [Pseudorhodobacter sp.]|nr:TOBE domain-containing protein [Pseudorhodobacter sp.]
MNILPVTLAADFATLADGQRIAMQIPAADRAGQKAFIGLRPEHLTQTDESNPNAIALTVRAVETLGADAYAHAALTGHAATEVVVRVPGAHPPAVGAKMHVLAALESTHLFDAATKARM